MPALRRIPPAHSAVVSQKIGAGLMWLGGSAIFLLGCHRLHPRVDSR